MGFNLRGMDTRYTDALLNLFGDIAKKEWEETQKQARFKKNIEALKTSGGLMGDIYPKGVSSEGTLDYGIRTPEEKIKLAESMSQFQRQQDIGKMIKSQALLEQPTRPTSNVNLLGMAKTGQKPEAKSMTTAGQRLLARQAVKETPPELQGRNFLLSAEGKYREGTPEEINKGKPTEWDMQKEARQIVSNMITKNPQLTFDKTVPQLIDEQIGVLKQKYGGTQTKETKPSLVKPKVSSDKRQEAMDYLKANNAPLTEKNIQYIIERL